MVFLPFLLPALSAIGALTGGTAGVIKTINDAKATEKLLEEAERHNRAMEGRGLYLSPYKSGKGLKKKKFQRRRKTDGNVENNNNNNKHRIRNHVYEITIFSWCFHAR